MSNFIPAKHCNNSDLQTRKTTREEAWKVEGWSDTVYKTGNLFTC